MTVLVMGSINMDLVVEAPRLPSAGETLKGTRFRTTPGGKGANQAVATALQGAPTRLIGRVGGDDFGPLVVDAIRAAGVGVSAITVDRDATTGIALICVAASGENTIVTVGGANHRVGAEDLESLGRMMRGARLLVVQLEIPLDVVESAVALARHAGVPVVCDPAPVAPLSDDILAGVSWITPNETETEALTGIAPADERSAAAAASVLRSRGVEHVAITLGGRGCFYLGPADALSIPAPDLDVVDTVAAGDAFNGALAAGLVTGLGPPDALRRACAAGALAASRAGAQSSLPTRAELDALVR
jgi:ribokinase